MRKKIERWENGQAEPTISEFKQLCDVLECDPEYLWGVCPTPRRETKQAMDITGLSENSIAFLAREKQADAKTKELAKTNPDYAIPSWANRRHEDTLNGLDTLLQWREFKETLPIISELSSAQKDTKAVYKEINKYRPIDDTDSGDGEWEFNVPHSLWDSLNECRRNEDIFELKITQNLNYLLRNLSVLCNRNSAESGE